MSEQHIHIYIHIQKEVPVVHVESSHYRSCHPITFARFAPHQSLYRAYRKWVAPLTGVSPLFVLTSLLPTPMKDSQPRTRVEHGRAVR